ncbi:M23 family metallopeptidase [Paenibacillus sp. MMS20-IR301]|uniref:M23 family metallopeptidase n=1 Tax=Paenibacillus sp. MMS20-IR301 TaxID=2895946 RepID=UPI0028EEFFD2|nr:M23 family metallopeptidase [Paenibacillus sp. MMS20-IR301]WNS43925.1 M23 family metallopeptidase [Paenibacillus sp. MMS20-IR301]
MKKSNYLSMLLLLLVLGGWAGALWVHGMTGVYGWLVLKFILPAAGAVWAIVNLVWVAVKLVKQARLNRLLLNLCVSAILLGHFLLTVNVIPLAYPVAIADSKPGITVQSPFHRAAVVGWGGDAVDGNAPHAVWPSERWAYDLVMEPYNTGSSRAEDYGIWNQEVYAPLDGIVIAAYDEEADITPGSEDILSMEGNYVYLKIPATGTYLLLNHLKQHSVTVEAGEKVQAGDLLGRVGNSGSTSEPHLHIHHQRQNPVHTRLPILAEGLPLYFEDLDRVSSMPVKGELITPAAIGR